MFVYSEKESTKIIWYQVNDILNNNIYNFEYSHYLKHAKYVKETLKYLKSINDYYSNYSFNDLFLEMDKASEIE